MRKSVLLLLFLAITTLTFAQNLEKDLNVARQYYMAGKYEHAYNMYIKLLFKYPKSFDVNMGYARSAYALQKYHQAILAYERVLVNYPTMAQIHLRITDIYLKLGDKDNAAKHTRLYNQLRPNAKRYVDEEERKTFNGYVAILAGYDTNANQGTGTVNYLSYTSDFEEVSSFYYGAEGTVNLNFDINKQYSFVSSLNAGYRKYTEQHEQFENTANLNTGLDFGIRYADNFLMEAKLHGGYNIQFNEEIKDENIMVYGGDLTLAIPFMANDLLSITKLVYDMSSYSDDSDKDSATYKIYQFGRFRSGNNSYTLGLSYQDSSADLKRYSNTMIAADLNIAIIFDALTTLKTVPFAHYHMTDYKAKYYAIDSKKREDKNLQLGVAFVYSLTDYIDFDLTYRYTKNESNSIYSDYNKHDITFKAIYNF